MPRTYVNQLKDGDNVEEVFLLADKQLRANRNADLYLLASLRDRTGTLNGLMWNVTEEAVGHLNSGDLVWVKGKVQLYQGALQMILARIQMAPPDGHDPSEFHPRSNVNTERMLTQLKSILRTIEDPQLRGLMDCFLIDEELMQKFTRAPAGVKTHHAYYGGLLEHVTNIMETANRISDLYPQVNRDLLLAGVFLHDLGKIEEMEYGNTFAYTDRGQLLGHMLIAVEILNEKVAKLTELTGEPFSEETNLRLKHMILSHHGHYQFGSSKLPMTPEAIALHHLDNLDAKVHEFAQGIAEDPNPDAHWTPFQQRLERKLFKGSKPKV